jgi:hypothetical protein
MKKKVLLFPLISLLSLPIVLADIGATLNNVFHSIIQIGNLGFLGIPDGSLVVGFVRLMIWILMFTIFFAVIVGMKDTAPMKYFTRGQAVVVSSIIATIAAVFLPAEVLLTTGSSWATIIALILIGGPIVGMGYLLTKIPGDDEDETRGSVLLKLFICLILFWILSSMKYHVGNMI